MILLLFKMSVLYRSVSARWNNYNHKIIQMNANIVPYEIIQST